MELALLIGVSADRLSLNRPVHALYAICPERLHIAAVHHGFNKIFVHCLRIFTGIGNTPDSRRSLYIISQLLDRRKGNQLVIQSILCQIAPQVFRPGSGPVGKYAAAVFVKLVAHIAGAVGQRFLINISVYISIP